MTKQIYYTKDQIHKLDLPHAEKRKLFVALKHHKILNNLRQTQRALEVARHAHRITANEARKDYERLTTEIRKLREENQKFTALRDALAKLDAFLKV